MSANSSEIGSLPSPKLVSQKDFLLNEIYELQSQIEHESAVLDARERSLMEECDFIDRVGFVEAQQYGMTVGLRGTMDQDIKNLN